MQPEEDIMSAIAATAPIWIPYAVAALGAGYAWLSKRWIFLRRVQPLLKVIAKAAVAEVEREYVAPTKTGGRRMTPAEQEKARALATKAVRDTLAKLGAGASEKNIVHAIEDAVWSLKPKVTGGRPK